jgi:tripartite-type tricarboxylate transporter receptor subunit TctC
LQGLLSGEVDLMFDNLGVSLPLVEAGKLKLLAVASPARLPDLPDVPTLAETMPGFEAVAWYGIVAPPRTPASILDKINADVNEALHQPDVQAQLNSAARSKERPTTCTARSTAGGPSSSRPISRCSRIRWASIETEKARGEQE